MAAAAVIAAVLLLLLPTGLSILDPTDYLALQSLRKSLSDLPGSAFLAAWDFTADPCTFPGVLCAGSRVIALALGDPRAASPGLTGRLDASALTRLSALSELSLVPGRVVGPVPSPLPPNLRFLALAHNLLSGPIPSPLPPRLRTLDLSSNRLSGSIPNLPALSNLVLSHNRLTGAVPSLPASLRYLDLSFNRLTGRLSDPYKISIERIDLSHNWLTGTVPAGLSTAAVVYLNDNRFTGEVPAVYFDRVMKGEMRLLYLQRNYLTGIAGPGAGKTAVVPTGAAMCLQYNCVTPPMGGGCSLRGRKRRRPAAQCPR